MQISKQTIASIEYTLTNDAGEVVDTSKGGAPLAYLHGVGGMIPGLEEELEGKSSGDSLQVIVAPEKAYGPRDEKMVQDVSRDQLPAEVEIEVGMQFQAQTDHGPHVVTVMKVDGENVTLDANHPLAGTTLHFDVRVVEVRAATEEELTHGHVHGEGGHHH